MLNRGFRLRNFLNSNRNGVVKLIGLSAAAALTWHLAFNSPTKLLYAKQAVQNPSPHLAERNVNENLVSVSKLKTLDNDDLSHDILSLFDQRNFRSRLKVGFFFFFVISIYFFFSF